MSILKQPPTVVEKDHHDEEDAPAASTAQARGTPTGPPPAPQAGKDGKDAGKALTAAERSERRTQLLEEIWLAEAEVVLAAVRSKRPTASTLQVGRAFLRDNDVTLDSLARLRNRVGSGNFDPGKLPKFTDDDDNDEGGGTQGGGQSPALRSIPPFAPAPPTGSSDDR